MTAWESIQRLRRRIQRPPWELVLLIVAVVWIALVFLAVGNGWLPL